MFIKEKLRTIKESIPEEVTLVAVSKTKSIAEIMEAYEAGQRVFGENKVQEMVQKQAELPKDIAWHMIGHVQKNKIKYMSDFVDLIHGVDAWSTLEEINKRAESSNRLINCLLQAKIAKEDSKFGLGFEEIEAILTDPKLDELRNIRIVGFMGMASFVEDEEILNEEFSSLKKFYDKMKVKTFYNRNICLGILSMGMSGDYQLAIKNGSNMVRVGSAIFGERNYLA